MLFYEDGNAEEMYSLWKDDQKKGKYLKNLGNAGGSWCSPGVGGFHHKKVSAVPAT